MNNDFDYAKIINTIINENDEKRDQAFKLLYENSLNYFNKIVVGYFSNDSDVEDALSDCYIKIYEKLGTLQEPQKFLAWGGKICQNTCINIIKSRINREIEQEMLMSSLSNEDAEIYNFEQDRIDYNPEAQMDHKETSRLIYDILKDLPPVQRECICMMYGQELSISEISETLDMPVNTVKSNLRLGREKVKIKVVELEKKGTKLYGLLPIPFFVWLLKNYKDTYTVKTTSEVMLATLTKNEVYSRYAAAKTIKTSCNSLETMTCESATEEVVSSINAITKESVTEGSINSIGTMAKETVTEEIVKSVGAATVKATTKAAGIKIISAIAIAAVVGTGGYIVDKTVQNEIESGFEQVVEEETTSSEEKDITEQNIAENDETKQEPVEVSLNSEQLEKLNVFLSDFAEQDHYKIEKIDTLTPDPGTIMQFVLDYCYYNGHQNEVSYGGVVSDDTNIPYGCISLETINKYAEKYMGISLTEDQAEAFYDESGLRYYQQGNFYSSMLEGHNITKVAVVKNLLDQGDGTYMAEFEVFETFGMAMPNFSTISPVQYADYIQFSDEVNAYALTDDEARKCGWMRSLGRGQAVIKSEEGEELEEYKLISYEYSDFQIDYYNSSPMSSELYGRESGIEQIDFTNSILTISGIQEKTDQYGSYISGGEYGVWKYEIDEDTYFTGSGGTGMDSIVTTEEFVELLKMQNGLGLSIISDPETGKVVRANLGS